MSDKENLPKIQALIVGFSIIELVAKSPQPLKFNDIHHHTKITKSNLHKYLHTLTSLGVLYRDQESGHYSGGPALIDYGMATVNSENILEKVGPFLEEINILSKETTLLAVWTHDGPTIIHMIHSRAGLNLGGQVGTVLPIHSAGGKLFGALLNGPLLDEWIAGETEHLSAEEKATLQTDFEEIQKNGIAFASEALAPSISSTAIPIFNHDSRMLGAIIIVGFQGTVPASLEEELSVQLLKKSEEISSLFGFSK
ncbi:IclR family transcriptional regulator [Sporosarcina soli]|uniref:IclR family transcriptional regulator n=1 Tax=Sporosarcina soli TaxID=334736 RepID=A0ABW0TD28_9BACL